MYTKKTFQKKNMNTHSSSNKAQFSLEFLMTYGWAMLIVLATAAALYSFGLFNVDLFSSQQCSFFGQIICKDYQAVTSPSHSVNIKVLNDFGTDLQIKSATFTTDDGIVCQYLSTSSRIPWSKSSIATVPMTGCNINTYKGSKISGKISVTYYRTVYSDNQLAVWCNSGNNVACTFTTWGTLTVKVS